MMSAAQEFISKKYDELLTASNDMKEKFATNITEQKSKFNNFEKKLNTNLKITKHNAKYTKRDASIFAGVPKVTDVNGKENCKKIIVDICNELEYPITEDDISTAHRLSQHLSKKGHPDIIAKFISRDTRNEVYALKEAARDKTSWECYNIHRLYINECLTPEAKRLLYHTKILKREMYRIHGNIFVWTFKGDVYVRKEGDKNPRIQITSENDLDMIRKGDITLDAPEVANDFNANASFNGNLDADNFPTLQNASNQEAPAANT